uniref:AB hydrolase-1 domain-containing protein n=1 Tax=Aplanochytrium stocchinoi TaxID=215587 RepID=A0A6S7ZQF1_9STRA
MEQTLPLPAGYEFDSRKVKLSTGICMHFIEKKPRQTESKGLVLCVHGWPDCWYGYRRNIDAICEAGYHVVVPDQRGYGQTSKPREVSAYEIQVLVQDNVALLDFLGIEKAVLVGHDWGGTLVWNFAMHFPERVAAVCSFCTPFFPTKPKKEPLEKHEE